MIIDHPCLRLHLNAPILPRIRKVQPVHLLNIYSYIYSTYTHTYTQHILNHCRFCTSYQNQSIFCSTHSEHSALPNQNHQIHSEHILLYPTRFSRITEHILLYPTRITRFTQSISCSTHSEHILLFPIQRNQRPFRLGRGHQNQGTVQTGATRTSGRRPTRGSARTSTTISWAAWALVTTTTRGSARTRATTTFPTTTRRLTSERVQD